MPDQQSGQNPPGVGTGKGLAGDGLAGEGQKGETAPDRYTWRTLLAVALAHRRELVTANLIALAGALVSVPIPLLMPLLVDEVLLGRPGWLVGVLDRLFPAAWHGPALYIGVMMLVTIALSVNLLGDWLRDALNPRLR